MQAGWAKSRLGCTSRFLDDLADSHWLKHSNDKTPIFSFQIELHKRKSLREIRNRYFNLSSGAENKFWGAVCVRWVLDAYSFFRKDFILLHYFPGETQRSHKKLDRTNDGSSWKLGTLKSMRHTLYSDSRVEVCVTEQNTSISSQYYSLCQHLSVSQCPLFRGLCSEPYITWF